MTEKDESVSRRQFLNYSVMGIGGFMTAGLFMPMIRSAIDPVVKPKSKTSMVAVTDISELSTEPKRFDFKVMVKDAWYESEETKTAWIFKDEKDEIIAYSPACKHLGCVVNWNGDPKNPNRFYCPCHAGYFEKDGSVVPKSPPVGPLDRYAFEVKEGTLYLGEIIFTG